MIPLVASVSFRSRRDRNCRLWIPLALVWLLLLPLVLMLLPVMFVICWVVRVDPVEAVTVFWQILSALKGTNMECGAGRSSVEIHVF